MDADWQACNNLLLGSGVLWSQTIGMIHLLFASVNASSTHNDEMCNLYVMYFTENGQNTYIVCTSNLFPDLFDHIPAGNDVTLPPNQLMDAVATGRLHRGIISYLNK